MLGLGLGATTPPLTQTSPCRYPRAGGLVPWRNAVFLFVNVLPAEQVPYPNAFLDGGRRITWYATDYFSLISRQGSRANSIALG